MAKCPSCRARQDRAAAFCDRCGAPLTPACPACGATNRRGARFCRACGLGLEPAGPPGAGSLTPAAAQVPGTLAGERKQVTVLFADMRGSMELLASRDPEEARAILDPVLERMVEAVRHYGGTVNQVLGDGIMALFGAPVAHEDHAVRACLAALRMQESVRRYARGLPPASRGVAIRVGLNSGEVVVRALRGGLHLEYTAVGHTTHLAARMEQLAAPGTVLATAATARLVAGYVEVVPRGEASVKGLGTPVAIFEVTGAGPLRSRLEAAAARGLSPFVGRQAELERLQTAWEAARAGRGCVVAVVGDAGVGKSRLVREFLARVRDDEPVVLASDPVTWETPAPYAWVADLLRRYFELEPSLEPGEVRARVERAAGLSPGLAPLVPALLAVLDALPADDPFHGLHPRRRRHLLHLALAQVVVEASGHRPVVTVFENAHAMDAGSEAALDELAERATGAPVLVLVTARPGASDRWLAHRARDRVVVQPLPPTEADRLLDGLLGAAPELEPLKRVLIARTEGNPFYLEECVRTLEELSVLAGARGAYRLAGSAAAIQLPPTVQATVAARIDRLSPEDKHLLQSAAVIGRDLAFPLLVAVAGLPAESARRSLDRLLAAELLEASGPGPSVDYRFTHALVQEVAYASLLHERRRALHARVVQSLEATGTDPGSEAVERLAHHAWHGGLWAEAATYLRRAGAKAAARAANAEAVAFLERALEALGQLPETPETLAAAVDVRLDLRPPLLQLGRLEDVLARSLEAERLAHALGDERRLAAVYSYLANYHYLRGEPEVAVGYGERCLTLAQRVGDAALHALATRYLAHIHHTLGEYRRAGELFATSLGALPAAARDAGEADPQLGIAYPASAAWLAFTQAEVGDFAAAHRYVEDAERAAAAGQHAYGQAIAATMAGLVWLRQGHPARALGPLERTLEACREKELTVWEPIVASLLGLSLARLGRKDDALPLLEGAVATTDRLGVRAYLALWTLHLAEGRLLAGDPRRAADAARRALDLAVAHRERGHEAWAHWLFGEIAAHTSAAPAAESGYRQALAIAGALGMRPLVARCHLGLGRLFQRAGARARAEDHVVQALALFCEMDMEPWARAACGELKALGRLLIVARERSAIHRYLTEVAGGEDGVTVILDRRRGDRRVRPAGERRRAERRRRGDIARRLATHGLAVVA